MNSATAEVVQSLLADTILERLPMVRRLLSLRDRFGDERLEAPCTLATPATRPLKVSCSKALKPIRCLSPPRPRQLNCLSAQRLNCSARLWEGCDGINAPPLALTQAAASVWGVETLQVRNQQAIDGQWTYIEFLSRLLEDEIERRAQKQLALRLRRAPVNTTKTLENFDFNFNPNLNRQRILHLAGCDFIRQKRNLLIYGPTGTGKTHLSQALTHAAARLGFNALFINTHKMLAHLNGGRTYWSWMTLASNH